LRVLVVFVQRRSLVQASKPAQSIRVYSELLYCFGESIAVTEVGEMSTHPDKTYERRAIMYHAARE
jgi:hypothetical protein